MMDGNPRLKPVERLTKINKLRNVAACWLHSENILAMHGPMNVKHSVGFSYKLWGTYGKITFSNTI